ncbi:hypothetical protein D2E26_1422 [Bifidobacterium dolichotidis]|uniref:Uncharacterized protein n=1 Tax=Bifidobacterium dolichotidis TaxID=2306976 RepID=A0A430FKS2_9BIFI|nr:hypothetical protein [Bifidobacterium dolichotidis]RSX53380.1 hypothetical protein D2E26_1422 [Bifidobacterium dolichotidis]
MIIACIESLVRIVMPIAFATIAIIGTAITSRKYSVLLAESSKNTMDLHDYEWQYYSMEN